MNTTAELYKILGLESPKSNKDLEIAIDAFNEQIDSDMIEVANRISKIENDLQLLNNLFCGNMSEIILRDMTINDLNKLVGELKDQLYNYAKIKLLLKQAKASWS